MNEDKAKIGRPKMAKDKKRRQIKIYVSPETEANIRASIGLKDLGHRLDEEFRYKKGIECATTTLQTI